MPDETLFVDAKTDELTKRVSVIKEEMLKIHGKLQKSISVFQTETSADMQQTFLQAFEGSKAQCLDDLLTGKKKLKEVTIQIVQLLQEMELHKLVSTSRKIIAALENFDVSTGDYGRFSDTIDTFVSDIGKRHEIDVQLAGRLWNNIKMGYYPTDTDNLQHIKRAIHFPTHELNFLDPCCGEGTALNYLAADTAALTYGVEIDELRAEEAKQRIGRIGKGSFFGSRISHDAFHMVFLNPPYLTLYNAGFNVRAEKRFLIDAIPHIINGGLLVYIVPYYRLTEDICRILADNFDNISVYRFTASEFKRFKQVAVFGTKTKRFKNCEAAERIFSAALNPDTLPTLETICNELYYLPSVTKKVEIFKGSVFDVQELQEQFKSSPLVKSLFSKSALDCEGRRPLLPFSIGQIGLIGGSGLLNGLIECELPHVLKGQIVKERKVTGGKENEDGEQTEVTETIVNKMNFKILTMDGVKSLS